jgi:hypothetical protein
MKTRTRILNYIAMLGLATISTPLFSTTVEYSTRSSWLAAVSGATTTNFDTAIPGYTPPTPDHFVNLAFGGITLDGVNFRAYNNNTEYALTVVNSGPGSPYYDWQTGGAILKGDLYQGALAHLHITLPTAVMAWGTDLMTGSSPGGTVSVQVNGGACSTACLAPTFALPTHAFFGMTSDTPFSVVDLFYPVNTYMSIDNFSTATTVLGGGDPPQQPTGDTPEVATILLCASGLIGMAKAKKIRTLGFI